jgi:hypothetical protein
MLVGEGKGIYFHLPLLYNMREQHMDAEGMRKWAKIKKLENERHELEIKMAELARRLQEVEEEIHKLGGT